MLALTIVVASVYSAAQDAHLPLSGIARQTLRRSAKLLGVLLAIVVVVFFLSRICFCR
jgi:hypothetical protein